MTRSTRALIGLAAFTFAGATFAATATFEDLTLAPESSGPGFTADGAWQSGSFSFLADWNETFNCCLSGFKFYSNRTDTTKVSFPDEDIASPGIGAGGSGTYAIAFGNGSRAELAKPTALRGVELTTTTITRDVILNGDPFADAAGYVFGGNDGNAKDFLKLTISGFDANANPTDEVEFFLADYRFDDNTLDYVVEDWQFVDLSSLGIVSALELSFSGSVLGFGMVSTPTYVALDNLQPVPLPSSILLLGSASLLLASIKFITSIRRLPCR